MSSLPLSNNTNDGGAIATLTNWDGHIAIENSPISMFGCNDSSPPSSSSERSYTSIGRPNSGIITAANNTSSHTGHTRPYSRVNRLSRQLMLSGSSLLSDSITEITIEDLQSDYEPTSAILGYCKRKFLQPYLTILSVVGMNPNSTDIAFCRAWLNYLQVFMVFIMLLLGYFLQYLCSYRGDRGFADCHSHEPNVTSDEDDTDNTCDHSVRTIGELLFGYIIPSCLHMLGFLSAIYAKLNDREQLQNLVERVFLVSLKPQRLCRILWTYVLCGFVLLLLLIAYVIPSVVMQDHIIQANWVTEALKTNLQLASKICLLITIFVQDLVEVIILSSYCIECYLLRVHLETLSQKLILHSIESMDWMREVLEFRKLLDHLNQRIAIPICFFTVMNLAFAFAGFIYLFSDFDFHYSALKLVLFNITNVLLWLFMGLLPFFMAAAVTRACQNAQASGHHIRVRPFVYQNTSAEDLNSTLLFASSLDMSAKLFRMPIQSNYLCFAIMTVTIVVLTLGMCVNITSLGSF